MYTVHRYHLTLIQFVGYQRRERLAILIALIAGIIARVSARGRQVFRLLAQRRRLSHQVERLGGHRAHWRHAVHGLAAALILLQHRVTAAFPVVSKLWIVFGGSSEWVARMQVQLTHAEALQLAVSGLHRSTRKMVIIRRAKRGHVPQFWIRPPLLVEAAWSFADADVILWAGVAREIHHINTGVRGAVERVVHSCVLQVGCAPARNMMQVIRTSVCD